jgi:hypothetical protein
MNRSKWSTYDDYKKKFASKQPTSIAPNLACKCGHPYSEHRRSRRGRDLGLYDCLAYDASRVEEEGAGWCSCTAFRDNGKGLISIPERIKDVKKIPIPKKSKPFVIYGKDVTGNMRPIIQYKAMVGRIPVDEELLDNMDTKIRPLMQMPKIIARAESAIEKRVMIEARRALTRAEKKRPRKSKKKAKSVHVDKFALTRAVPADDDEV